MPCVDIPPAIGYSLAMPPHAEAEPTYDANRPALAAESRPRARLVRHGPQALSTVELLSLVLGTGKAGLSPIDLARSLVKEVEARTLIAEYTVSDLRKKRKLSAEQAVTLLAALELGRRVATDAREPRQTISAPQDVCDLLAEEIRNAKREIVFALLLDSKNHVLKVVTVSIGSLNTSVIHPREVFTEAVAISAASIIVAHNHPSGDPTPSAEDRAVSSRLCEAGKLMGIDVLDHIVMGDGNYRSMKQMGYM